MREKYKIPIKYLKNTCDVDKFEFETTKDLQPLQGIIGQNRAVDSLEFGLDINKKGYNIFVSGESGTGRNSYVMTIAKKKAHTKKSPSDLLYVYNFNHPDAPMALKVEAGEGKVFKKYMEDLVALLRKQIPKIFISKDYENEKSVLNGAYQRAMQKIIQRLNAVGEKYGFIFKQTEKGIVRIPIKDHEPLSTEDYQNLTHEELEKLRSCSNQLSLDTVELFNQLRNLEEKYKRSIQHLDEKMGLEVIDFHLEEIKEKFTNSSCIQEYLRSLKKDMIEHMDEFKSKDDESTHYPFFMFQSRNKEVFFNRYKVNLLMDHSDTKGAPIVNESNPSYYNLIGAVEYKNELGVMKTDFMQIKPGALHQANGGYLIVQAKDLLANPFSWNALKRSLKIGKIIIEGLDKQVGYMVTSTIKPQPIDLDLKVIVIGDAYTYNLLYRYDEEFSKLFKIMADFDTEMVRNEENMYKMARFIKTHCQKENLHHFDKEAVAKTIEYSSRMAERQDQLSSRFHQIVEVLYEADHYAQKEGSHLVKACHVQKAIHQKIYRSNKYEEKILQMIQKGSLLLDVTGKKIGEINGLAVISTGEYSFGKPSKITVTTYEGKSGIVNIEREVKKSGSIHDKGVLILNGYLGEKFAQNDPLSLSANIAFEQLYSGIDGDSASSTELYALLSSLSEVPIDQSIAVTGSVNQRGEIQPIGGVNEKIEGFFKVCQLKGLTKYQGVMIPKQNIENLMLSQEVIHAIQKDEFHIYAVSNIEEGIEVLTKKIAGKKEKNGKFTKNSVFDLVDQKLRQYAKKPSKIHQRKSSKSKQCK